MLGEVWSGDVGHELHASHGVDELAWAVSVPDSPAAHAVGLAETGGYHHVRVECRRADERHIIDKGRIDFVADEQNALLSGEFRERFHDGRRLHDTRRIIRGADDDRLSPLSDGRVDFVRIDLKGWV